jgi:hypothetical protein
MRALETPIFLKIERDALVEKCRVTGYYGELEAE